LKNQNWLLNFLIAALLVLPTILPSKSLAAKITFTDTSNPSTVTASLANSCDNVYAAFEKQVAKMFSSVPYVSSVSLMGATEWKEDYKDGNYTNSSKTVNVAATPTLRKEFPDVYLPLRVSRTVCNPKRETTAAPCSNQYAVTMYGSDAVVYQKVTEVTKNQSWIQSFQYNLTLVEDGTTKCTAEQKFSINNNSYLWAKRHLVKDINPTLIESRLLTRFADWAKTAVTPMEAN
jgi:hypothetical protein